MESPNNTMDAHLKMERQVATMRSAMDRMEKWKKTQPLIMPNGMIVR